MKTYKQTRKDSCGPSAMLMAVEYLRPGTIPMTPEEEHRIHDQIGMKGKERYTLPCSICKFLVGLDFKMKFFEYKPELKHRLMRQLMALDARIRRTITNNFQYIAGDFTTDNIAEELDQNRAVMVAVNLNKSYDNPRLHWYFVYKHDKSGFTIADPRLGKIITEPKSELEELIKLPDGCKVCISIED
ncbi:hypothetical protein GF371_02820 [Candidatus Woesearchaeota archaeon]|nr:hypothetical protein [Candidatus Woesearchaeota archaeon]